MSIVNISANLTGKGSASVGKPNFSVEINYDTEEIVIKSGDEVVLTIELDDKTQFSKVIDRLKDYI